MRILVFILVYARLIAVFFTGFSVLISSFVFPYHSFLPAWRHLDESFAMKPTELRRLSVTSGLGNPIQIMILVNGDEDVHFILNDQNGKTVINETLTSGRHYFEARLDCFLFFDSETNHQMHLEIWIYYYEFIFLFIGSFICLSGIVGSLYKYRREAKEERPSQGTRLE